VNLAFGYGTASRATGENHDAFGAFRLGDWALLVVCDGQGASGAAAQASAIAVRTIHEVVGGSAADPEIALLDAVVAANRAIYEEARRNHRLMGMSASVAAVLIVGDIAHVAHVGNCRAYHARGGRPLSVTRDHTMVNTFVDNELLSPEDAASHPEAHVLSRALGSERQIDVDIQQRLLTDGDTLILCTDGVHRALDDAQICDPDWSTPERAAQHPIRRAQSRGSTDAATLVGCRHGGAGDPGQPATLAPVVEQSGDMPTPMSMDEVRSPTLLEEPQPPALFPIDPSDEPTDASEGASSPSPHRLLHDPRPRTPVPATTLPPRVVTRTPPPPPPKNLKKERERRLALIIGICVLALCVLLCAGAIGTREFLDARRAPGIAVAVDPSELPGDPLPPADLVATAPPTEPDPAAALNDPIFVTEVDIAREPGEFANIRLPPLRRNTRSTQTYTSAPPSPAPRINIQRELGRRQGCASVEQIIHGALRDSPAFAPLYRDLWNCYQDLHDPHVAGQVPTAIHFIDKRPHLEGELKQPNPARPLPLWYLPANDGIERRLDLYDQSAGLPDGFHDVIHDAFDVDTVVTRFHYDLLAEAAFAQAFSTLPNPTAGQVQDWARRVHVVRKHRATRVGQLIEQHDPPADRRIREVLAAATFDFERHYQDAVSAFQRENPGAARSDVNWRSLAAERRVPTEVAEALLVAAGYLPAPDGRPVEPDEATKKVKPPTVQRDPCLVNPTDPRCIP
jgi:PPM family protein phosphatase